MLKQRDDLITTTKAAHMLGVSRGSIQAWVEKGMLRALKTPGGHRRIALDSVNLLLQQWNRSVGSSQSSDSLNMLVVEDDPLLLNCYVNAIQTWELPVRLRVANDGFDGLVQVGRELPDIIITDLRMPGIDGFQMVRSLKAKPELVGIRIIAVTALEPHEISAYGGLPKGVQVFLKPLPMKRLKNLIHAMILNRQTLDGIKINNLA